MQTTTNTRLVNLTPHLLNILVGDESISVSPEWNSARLITNSTEQDPIIASNGITVPVSKQETAVVANVPDPQPNTVYIVSLVVAQYVKRPDVVSPGRLVRDGNGNPIGCIGLTAHA